MEKFMTSRPQRNRRHSRRAWPPEDDLHQPRLVKRLFTPEIKRMLKDWLVRRRENPYPSRNEKKRLAIDTGLTYTQICNWFANWRRKLKNSERERSKKSWGHLIKHYNTNARGNVEQFSISSEDSIWEEDEYARDVDALKPSDDDEFESREDGISSGSEGTESSSGGRCYDETDKRKPTANYIFKNQTSAARNLTPVFAATANSPQASVMLYNNTKALQQTTGIIRELRIQKPIPTINTAKYKQKMMEKYLRDTSTQNADANTTVTTQQAPSPNTSLELSTTTTSNVSTGNCSDARYNGDNKALTKWLESAARFTPNKNNYFIEWNGRIGKLERKQRVKQLRRVTIIPANSNLLQRQRTNTCPTQLELDAAEALANMAFNCRQRMFDCNSAGASLQTVGAISS